MMLSVARPYNNTLYNDRWTGKDLEVVMAQPSYYPSIYQEGLRTTTKTFIMIESALAEIQTASPKYKLRVLPLHQPVL
jgi:hypothetical protein